MLDQPIQAFPSDLEGGRRIAAPQRDLGADHVQVDGELSVVHVARLLAGELEMAAGGREVPGPQEQVGERDVEVDRADARQDVLDVLLEQGRRLRVARQLDQHRGRVRLQEPSETELATVSFRARRRRPARFRALPPRSHRPRACCRGSHTSAGARSGHRRSGRSRGTAAGDRSRPRCCRGSPGRHRGCSARAHSMAWAPTVRALSMARSANGTDSAHLPASIRLPASPARTRASSVDGDAPSSRSMASSSSRIEVAVSPASQDAYPNRSRARARRPAVVGGVGIDEVDGALGEVDRVRGVADQGRGRTRGVEQVREVAIGRAVGGGNEVPQLDRALVLAAGLGVRVDRARGVARRDRGTERAGRVLGRPPVMGDLDEPCGGRDPGADRSLPRWRARRPRAGPGARTAAARRRRPPRRARAGIDSARRARPGRRTGVGRRSRCAAPDPARRSDRPQTSARRSCSTCRPATAATSTSLPAASEPAARRTWRTPRSVSGRRSRPRPGSSAAAASSSAKNAFPSERRAIESTRAVARRRTGDAGQQLDELAALEPRQVDAIDARLALGLGQPGGQRMAAMQFVAAEGRDDEQPLVARVARQEGEQVAGRTVGPVQVLDDEQDRARLAEPAEQPQRALEDAGLEPFGLARRGGLAARPATPRGRAARARAGSVRPPRRSRSGSTWRASDRRASTIGPNGSPSSPSATAPPSMTSQSRSRRRPTASRDQAALADPGLAADEDEGRMAVGSRIGRREERVKLLRTADEDRAAQAPGHALA